MTEILVAKNIKKTFYHPHPITILKGINLSVHPGDSVAIMGRSGEGKSTLLQILGTLENPSDGELYIKGKNYHSHTNAIRNRHIGFVFQSFHLLEDYTALDNVMMPARIARRSSREAKDKAESLLEAVGLSSRMHYFAKQLSGGEKQRISIARAFLNEPDLILADEPSGNLDRKTAHDIHELLLNYAHEKNKALILVTHDQELSNLCRKQYRLKDGLLVN